jgi:peptide/nickel transport system substrate-binding protein
MKQKRLYPLFAIVLLAILMAGCGAQPATQAPGTQVPATQAPTTQAPTTQAPATQAPTTQAPATSEPTTGTNPQTGTPKSGGILRMTMDQDPASSLDPTVPFDNSSIWTILNVYDQFYRVGKDGKSIEPDAAEKYEMSPDGLTYTFTMRQGLTFSDGTPVTIDDIVFSEGRMLKSENWGFLFPTDTVVKAGDQPNTVVFTLKQPNAPFVNNLAGFWSSIVPKKQVEALGDKFWDKPIGSGPFAVKEWVKGGAITLEKNPNYWDKPYPYLDGVVLNFIPDDNARVTQFEAGELDVALYVPYGQIDSVKATDGVTVQIAPIMGMTQVDINISAKPFDDIRVRQALAYGTDKQAIIDAVLFGYGEPANVMWPKTMYWSADLGGYKYDPEKAKQLLADAGLAKGFDLTLSYIAGDQTREQVGTILIDQWGKLGINTKLEALDSTTFNQRFSSTSLQVALDGYTSDVIDPSELNFIYLCSYAKPRNGACNDKVDQLATQADQEMDPAKREQLYHQLMQEATDWLIDIPMFYTPSRTGIWNYVKNFQILPAANFRLWEVWLDK